ncbi:MAG: LysR family transcriptional regulator [Burkholderiaceae bacterium]|jgi:DNA-binding transcriptional LysR family regulator|nr:LysR family transcriptional regulator [Burkholderiaceae bacterium]MCU0929242.1 LysR family transcriptional regulator [Burkholderiaceae bacterium]
MAERAAFDKIELHLVRVFHTVITERSVSRAAMKLATTQPAVSAQLKRLRELVGDPLLVRAGTGMAPTAVALELLEPADALLRHAQTLFGARTPALGFDPASARITFRIAASDYLDPLFLPELVARVKTAAPDARLEILPLSREFDYRQGLAHGDVDLVIGNWMRPPAELHLGRLLSDEIVCLVAGDHPAVKSPRGWTVERYLASEHVAPTPLHAGAPGVIDEYLAAQGLQRDIAVRSPHFGLVPLMVARSRLVLTTGHLFCSRYVGQFPVRIVRCPVAFPSLVYYQLWHEVTHASASGRWLREQVRDVARDLARQLHAPVAGTS